MIALLIGLATTNRVHREGLEGRGILDIVFSRHRHGSAKAA
jgi:hypothetical protein